MVLVTYLAVTLIVSLLLDVMVRPRRTVSWRWPGVTLHLLVVVSLFGLFLTASGSGPVSATLALSLMTLLVVISNAKRSMLGEPLLFSDLALFVNIFRHPRFYLAAVPARQRFGAMLAGPALVMVFALLFVSRWKPHLWGGLMLGAGLAGLAMLPRRRAFADLAPAPHVDADLERLGLLASLFLYWQRWRHTPDPYPGGRSPLLTGNPEGAPASELIVVIQCESFADPVELTGNSDYALERLSSARRQAWQWGNLKVSGFGAYTMRTEYGVLFGRSETELGFRRFDPFLTAHGEADYALSAQLRSLGYRCLFVHPHDMRFYGRDRLMPRIGFDRLIGREAFPPTKRGEHRYVKDRVLGASIGKLCADADGPTLIYAVTMENHGPWTRDKSGHPASSLNAYLECLQGSDGMLSDLIDGLSACGRSAILIFFGDHRPSIPGVTAPGGPRHTPYVMLRFSPETGILTGDNARVDLSPDELHHAILRCA